MNPIVLFVIGVMLFLYLAIELGIRILFWFQSGRNVAVYKIMLAIYFGREY